MNGGLGARVAEAIRRLRRPSRTEPAREKARLAILIGALTVVSLTIGIVLGIRQLLPDPEPPSSSVLILMDTSRTMRQPFGQGKSKLDAVRTEILSFAGQRPDAAFALRFTGGECSESYTEPAVAFELDNTSEIKAALQDARPLGKSDFASGLNGAVNDFARYETGGSARVQSIYLFLGSGDDDCTSDVYHAISTALDDFERDTSINPGIRFNFFGLGASRAEARRLRNLVARLERAKYEAHVTTPENPRQLSKAVQETSLREKPSS